MSENSKIMVRMRDGRRKTSVVMLRKPMTPPAKDFIGRVSAVQGTSRNALMNTQSHPGDSQIMYHHSYARIP